ncbi:MAG: fused MFS/spermidine synthase [Planctomycetota bacterium]
MSRWGYPSLALLTGASVMIFEFGATYLFRGSFGQTVYVWANVIGVILAALALGYALGGRWADVTNTEKPLVAVLVFAGVYGLFVAWFGPAFCAWLAGPEEYTQDAALDAFFSQSLAATLVLFFAPLAALGMATPLMVQRASAHWPVGRAAGLIFAVGTVGSIIGIYLTTFTLVPTLGARATIRLAAAVLLALGALVFWLGRRKAGVPAALMVAAVLPIGWTADWSFLPPQGAKLLLALESPYQLVRVVDRPPDADGKRQRWLAFDEGMGTYHSIQVSEETPWTDAYYDAFAYIPAWVGSDEKCRVCIVGNAAGTMADLLKRHNPLTEFEIDAIEIDPAVTEAARRTMGLQDSPDIRIVHEDGRTFLRKQPGERYDAIIMDAYARQVSIPASLATKEFFELAESRLRPGGGLFVNLGTLRYGGVLSKTIADTMHAGFGDPVYRAPMRGYFNQLLTVARDAEMNPPPRGTRLDVTYSFGRHLPGNRVLTDDFCPIETITARDLRGIE